MADLGQIMEWTFLQETSVPKEVEEVLLEGEVVEA